MRSKHYHILHAESDELSYQIIAEDPHPEYIPYQTRKHLLSKYGYKCAICRKPGRDFHIDHIEPISKGGKAFLHNLQVLCPQCNLQKSNHFIDPSSYEKGYVRPIYVEQEWKQIERLLEMIEDEHF